MPQSLPSRKLAVLTCMDTRIDPLAALGMTTGEAVILRNAGARFSDDVRESLELSQRLLGVERLLVLAHSDCRAAAATGAPGDPAERARATAAELGASGLAVEAAVYDVETGRVTSA
jgi:carbonic anhydrase